MQHNGKIVVEGLVKRFGDFAAVDDISFAVEAGEIYGFLGPNGAGKSTTISILTTLSLPTSGCATIGGYDVVTQANQVRRVSGVALQEVGLDPTMKPLELLTLQGRTFGKSYKQALARAHDLLALVKLTQFVDRQVGKFSGGMRRRLDLALALVHQPRVLFLDEPTTGLDPSSRRDIWAEVRRLNTESGMTIFLTTQYLEEADQLAGRIAIINMGKLAVEGKPAALKAQIGGGAINVDLRDSDAVAQAREAFSDMMIQAQSDGHILRLYLPNAAESVAIVVNRLQAIGLTPGALTVTQPTLDDVFLQVTGQRFNPQSEAAIA
ncbi:MAG: ATP-binding cassette domain-containing protein [Chloroflexi bacterium]|nr:ATP-binding cassette domain-containing protein [Chloroflexota bacterium]